MLTQSAIPRSLDIYLPSSMDSLEHSHGGYRVTLCPHTPRFAKQEPGILSRQCRTRRSKQYLVLPGERTSRSTCSVFQNIYCTGYRLAGSARKAILLTHLFPFPQARAEPSSMFEYRWLLKGPKATLNIRRSAFISFPFPHWQRHTS